MLSELLIELRRCLGPAVSEQGLVRMLWVIRAPREFPRMVPAMQTFADWRRDYPALRELDGCSDYAAVLGLLDRIATITTSQSEYLANRRAVGTAWTPLRPLTGDSVIGELLLIQADRQVDSKQFEQVSAWLVWQILRFQQQWVSPDDYATYLGSATGSLKDRMFGHRPYSCYLALRELTEDTEDARASLQFLADHTQEMTPKGSVLLTILSQLALNRKTGAEHLRRYAQADYGLADEELDRLIKDYREHVPQEFGTLLRAIWQKEVNARLGVRRRSRGGVSGRQNLRPHVRPGKYLTEVFQTVDEDDVHAGVSIDFYPEPKSSSGEPRLRARGVLDDDDPEDLPEEPEFSLYLAQQEDLVQGYYAARGVQHAVEYDNARLRWDKWTLSREAILAVVRCVERWRDRPTGERPACLLVGLSLLSGRSLDEVAKVWVVDTLASAPRTADVVIALYSGQLYVRAGTPNLRGLDKAAGPFRRPRADYLALALPAGWLELAGCLDLGRKRQTDRLVRIANGLLAELPVALHITQKGVRTALLRCLDDLTRGDLGVLAALTAGTEANSRNIIHYASYARSQLEAWWYQAANQLLGSVGNASSAEPVEGWVGAVDSFDLDQVATHIRSMKERMAMLAASGEWLRLFNLRTAYLSYWLGLGSAGRRTRRPVPALTLDDGWAFVADKRREDRFTDRLVPVTAALRREIENYVAFASDLALAVPGLDPLQATDMGLELHLHYIYLRRRAEGEQYEIRPFVPKAYERHDEERSLPANWGRKVVRTSSDTLTGRWRDAELGHWVRGRHAWDATSTFNPVRFRDSIVALQEVFESRLGFEPVVATGLDTHQRPPRVPLRSKPAKTTKLPDVGVQELPARAIDVAALLAKAHENYDADLTEAAPPDRGQLALDLANRVVRDTPLEQWDARRALAENVCEYLSKTYKVPLFAQKPRPVLSPKVVLEESGLRSLARLREFILPAFQRDLEALPACLQESDPEYRRFQQVEVGRLLMVGIWRLGLLRWRLLGRWLTALVDGRPILAQGPNRYMELHVTLDGTMATVRRTVLLDDFTAAYLTLSSTTLPGHLKAVLFQGMAPAMGQDGTGEGVDAVGTAGEAVSHAEGVANDAKEAAGGTDVSDVSDADAGHGALDVDGSLLSEEKKRRHGVRSRRRWAESCLQAYLERLGVPTTNISLATLFEAAGQALMVESAPIVSGYAKGWLETEDLGDGDLRRLACLTSQRHNNPSPWKAVNRSMPELGNADLPDGLQRQVPLLVQLGMHRSPLKSEWANLIRRNPPASPIEALLQRFTVWLVQHAGESAAVDPAGKPRKPDHLSVRDKKAIVRLSRVVTYSFLGFTQSKGSILLDRDTLARLQEISRDQFPDRLQHGAWFQFQRFLRSGASWPEGVVVEEIGLAPESTISAKILSRDEIETIRRRLRSTRSGIGSVAIRKAAELTFELMTSFGMRRSEAAYLRPCDVQGDAIRVQASGTHTLKTAWADRVLPLGLAEPGVQEQVRQAAYNGNLQLIDGGNPTGLEPNNYYNALNQLCKEVTGDRSIGSHHLRHTLISRLVLTLLWDAAGLDALSHAFPWLKPLRVSDDRLRAWLGGEGDGGQGMRAIAALVGHAHPTTTIRHYTHVMGLVLRGALDKVDTLDLTRSFLARTARSSLYRHLAQHRGDIVEDSESLPERAQVNRQIRDWIEARQVIPTDGETPYIRIDRDETPVMRPESTHAIISFDDLESLDQSLREGQVDTNLLAKVRRALERIHAISTGKRGSKVPRHVLEDGGEGIWLPPRLDRSTAPGIGDTLCHWLDQLYQTRRKDFVWLMRKWLHASERERVRMTLRRGEVARAKALAVPGLVHIEITPSRISTRRQSSGAVPAIRMQIKCIDSQGAVVYQDTMVVRWVMTWVAAWLVM